MSESNNRFKTIVINKISNTESTMGQCIILLIEIERKSRKTLYRPKISAEISAERLSVLNVLSVCLQKFLLSAEIPSFGRKGSFRQANSNLFMSKGNANLIQDGTIPRIVEYTILIRRIHYPQKYLLSAEIHSFGRKTLFRQNIGIGRN